jgi:hypothetical protein
MQITMLKGYPDAIGRRKVIVGYGSGPASYLGGAGNGDQITGLPFQFYIDVVSGPNISQSGNYIAIATYSAVGARATWKLRYFAFSTSGVGSEVANATNLSAEKFQVTIIGGLY